MQRRLFDATAPRAVVPIRVMVGAVFISEGIQKFLFASELGAGRFARTGLPAPEFLGPLVGTVEIAAGGLILLGLARRLAAIPLITIMIVALLSAKWPILRDEGFWTAAHESRTDWSMLCGSTFLLIVGAGPLSLDGALSQRLRLR